ncbi:MAG: lysylphosphatidylglycerol synthase domain-containing protein [Mycobacteriales bacterium]
MTWTAHRFAVVLGLALAAASLAVPTALGVHLHAAGLAQAALGSALLVGCSALALNGSRTTPLTASRAVPAVLATTAANAVTPAGVGGTLLTMRIHRRSGLTTEEAAAAAGLRTAFGALAATLAAGVAASTVGTSLLPTPPLAVLLAVPAVLVAATLLPVFRTRVLPAVRRTAGAVGEVLRRPRCLASLMIGCVGVTVAQVLTLQGAVAAVGGHLPWQDLLAALVGSAAARSAVPSPGGVGPIEAALVGGLTTMGMGWGTASAAVAIYRTAGHWLPVVAGVMSLAALRRRHLV